MDQQITIKQVAGGYTVAYIDKSGKRQEVFKPNQKQAQIFAERISREK